MESLVNLNVLEEVLNHIHNWFVRDSRVFTNLVISGGEMPEELREYVPDGIFYRIQGSFMNDGVHSTDDPLLEDEVIERAVVSRLAIPRVLLDMVDEIAEWEEKYGEVAKGPFFSEEFGGYSYEIRGYSSYGAAASSSSGWRLAFADRLAPWRKMY